MKMILKSLHLENFKGVKDETYVFDGDALVEGRNGAGKTTIMDAYFFLFCNCDSHLHSNPDIRPIRVEECTPRVEAVIDIDGKVITIAKQQKRTVSKPNAEGISKIALTNAYEINSVPKSERDFKEYLSDCGMNFELFLPLCHADVFTAQKTADMRKALFSMISNVSDYDVASGMDDIPELLELLSNYTVEEVSAMQKATLRKITEEYGKEGEILRAKIEGLESAKIEIDVASLELGKADAQHKIDEVDKKLEAISEQEMARAEMKNELANLRSELSTYVTSCTADATAKKNECGMNLRGLRMDIDRINSDKNKALSTIAENKVNLENAKAQIKDLSSKLLEVKNEVMPENLERCPACGQKLPESKRTKVVENYVNEKQSKVNSLSDWIKSWERTAEQCEQTISFMETTVNDCNKQIADLMVLCDKEESAMKSIAFIDPSETDRYKSINGRIKKTESDIAWLDCQLTAKDGLLSDRRQYEAAHHHYVVELSQQNTNASIDDKICELRDKQTVYEQNRADAENILNQVAMLNKRKNELLTDEINKHFKLVKWVLFRFAKNGNYEDCCVATVDGKELGVSTNNALEIMAKVDICEGLQNYYGQHYPILLDNIEAIDTEGRKALVSDSQLIMFAVTDSALTVKEA